LVLKAIKQDWINQKQQTRNKQNKLFSSLKVLDKSNVDVIDKFTTSLK